MTLSNFVVNQVLGTYFPTTASHFLALHVADPTTAGLASTEVSTVNTPVYARKPVAWSAPANRGVYNTQAISWNGMPAMEISWLGVWDSLTNGNLLAALACPQPLVVTANGQAIYLPPGSIAVILGGSPTQRAIAVGLLGSGVPTPVNLASTPTTVDTTVVDNPALAPA